MRALAFCAGQEANVEPNVVSYSAMIDACAKVGDAIRAQRWHQRMRISAHVKTHGFPCLLKTLSFVGCMKQPWRLWSIPEFHFRVTPYQIRLFELWRRVVEDGNAFMFPGISEKIFASI